MKIKQLLLPIIIYFTGIIIFLINPSLSFAQVVFTDDFTNGYEKWEDVHNSFDLWSIVEEQADVFVNRRSTFAELVPKDEYWNNDWKNYIYKLDYTYLEGADKLLSFWYQDNANFYQFHFVGNSFILSHAENSRYVWEKKGYLILRSGTTYKMEVHLEDGNIKFYVNAKELFNVNDPTFNNDHGKIGIKSGAGNVFPTHVQFDNIEVSLISDIIDYILPVNSLKQTDPVWKDIEYDSATTWADENIGIGAWGCLVTSINMILDYHQIYNLPDGTKITPETLNEWLKNQEDGFVGPGLVNWSAVTRLVKEINNVNGTVNLEYSRVANSSLNNIIDTSNNSTLNINSNLEPAILEIQNDKPVILEIPGHFLVGNGVNQQQDDLFISDPAYSRNLLSQHQKDLLSTRLLTPSYTDLSYIHIAHDQNISTMLKDSANDIPANYQTYSQSISSIPNSEFLSSQESPEYTLHEISKPESGIYELEITNNTDLPVQYNITIFTYDVDANLTNLTYSGIIGTEDNSTVLAINFNKNGSSTITSNSSFVHLLKDIKVFKNKNEIIKNYVNYELEQLTNTAINANTSNKLRYITAIKSTLNWYSENISESANQLINQRLIEIGKTLNN